MLRMPQTKRPALAPPMNVKLRQRDVERIRKYVDDFGESASAVVRDLVSEALAYRDAYQPKTRPPLRAQNRKRKPSARAKLAASGTRPDPKSPYIITGVTHTTEEEI